jgi:hypothetical protein
MNRQARIMYSMSNSRFGEVTQDMTQLVEADSDIAYIGQYNYPHLAMKPTDISSDSRRPPHFSAHCTMNQIRFHSPGTPSQFSLVFLL